MEQSERYQAKLKNYIKAVTDFRRSMDIDLCSLNDDIKDAVRNGQVHKFEIAIEQTWRVIKHFMILRHESDVPFAKDAISAFWEAHYIDEEECERLLEMVKARNTLSHVYKESDYQAVYGKLPAYLASLIKVVDILEAKK